MAEPYIGEIIMFAGNFAPNGWALCNGQLLPISQYSALFSILGTTYGGDGRSTFGLPNLQCRVPVHPGTAPGLSTIALGESAGSESVTILSNNLPPHAHTVAPPCSNVAATVTSPVNNYPAVDVATGTFTPPSTHGTITANTYAPAATGQNMAAYQTGLVGSGIPINIEQPYLAVNFIIALQGVFPPRS